MTVIAFNTTLNDLFGDQNIIYQPDITDSYQFVDEY